jgi:hypothetical protein
MDLIEILHAPITHYGGTLANKGHMFS